MQALVKFVKRRDKRMIRRTVRSCYRDLVVRLSRWLQLELKEQAAATQARRQAEQAQKVQHGVERDWSLS